MVVRIVNTLRCVWYNEGEGGGEGDNIPARQYGRYDI